MAKHNLLGKEGEEIAASYLVDKGYKILETGWRFEKKEIDIIARIKDIVAIVEVKTRSTDIHGRPEESVTLSKQRFLIDAADNYANNLSFEADIRFDIISIIKQRDHIHIEHIEDAFIPLIE